MNYNEYNDRIDLSDELYEKTLSSVKSAVLKHNQIQKRKKTALLSAAACFVVFACSVSTAKFFSKNPVANKPKTTVNSPTENPNNDSSIKIIAEASKFPHKIIIDNKIYSQYYFGDAKGDKDNNIELKPSDIGELICQLDYFNLTDDLSNFEPMSSEEAKTNKFYKAKAYKYTKAKSDNIIIVQVKDEYYMFYLDGLTDDYTVEEILNIYTANGANEIVGIEIWQDAFFESALEIPDEPDVISTDVLPLKKGVIKDKEAINSILTILNNKRSDNEKLGEYAKALTEFYKSNSLINEHPLMEEFGVYELKIKFSDGSEWISDSFGLNVFLQKDNFCFNICGKVERTYYLLDNSEYDKLIEIINSAI